MAKTVFVYTPEQDRALTLCFQIHRAEWPAHVSDYPELALKSLASMKHRIFKELHLGTMQRDTVMRPAELTGWPQPGTLINGAFYGTRLFEIDPAAIRDHGFPATMYALGSAPMMHSASGCSASWAVGNGAAS